MLFCFANRYLTFTIFIILLSCAFSCFSTPLQEQKFKAAFQKHQAIPSLQNYIELRNSYSLIDREQTDLQKRWMFAQQIAAVDTFYGRYIDAESRLYKVRPNYGKAKQCPGDSDSAVAAIETLSTLLNDTELLLINESHTRLSTRSFNLRILSMLKGSGFTHLAIEALSDRIETSQVLRNWVPQANGDFGYYTREPLMAEIIREAQKLGFVLIAYDDFPKGGREAREEYQATSIASIVNDNKTAKVVVLAGYSHIYRNNGWMAERLVKKINKKLLSVDQVRFLNGCSNFEQNIRFPYFIQDKEGNIWSDRPDRVDVSVIHKTIIDPQTRRPSWLGLNKKYKPIKVDKRECNNSFPCLISVYYSNESNTATPAAKRFLESENDSSWIFLAPGKYRYKIVNNDGRVKRRVFSVAYTGGE